MVAGRPAGRPRPHRDRGGRWTPWGVTDDAHPVSADGASGRTLVDAHSCRPIVTASNTIRRMHLQSRDPLVMVPGGEPMPWPPEDPRFTEPARRALGFAQDEAARLNHNHIGAPHVFVGAVREPGAVARPLLDRLSVTLDGARAALEAVMGASPDPNAPKEL